ncbi:MAG: hypothetical protein IPL52_06905 [Flavobacteriales bacterium]|nr:hypothetical protein [Flavobacteriales bacterium]
MRTLLLLAMLACYLPLHAQNVAVNADGAAPDASALLDIDATALPAGAKKGMLVPRLALTATNVAAPVVAPATSLLVYNTATAGVAPNNVTPGYYYWNGAVWVRFATTADGWLTVGNAGTVAGTNFIGTTDAVDWVIKTGGSAAANERARVRSTGQVVVNNTAHFAGDVFSVYASNTTNGTTTSINNAAGAFAVNGYGAGNGTGVYGETAGGASTTGVAVWGDLYGAATTASGTSVGVYGSNTTAPAGAGGTAGTATGVRGDATGAPGTAFSLGVVGLSTGTTGNAGGVYGQGSSNAYAAVLGVNADATAGTGSGVQGQAAGIGGAAGVRGFNTAAAIAAGQGGYGMRGTAAVAPTGTGFVMGVRGDATGATGNTYGIYGSAASATGFGSYGINTNASGTGLLVVGQNAGGTYLTLGSGIAANGNSIGTFSFGKTAASGIGVVGIGNNLIASIFTPASGCGVAGTGAQYGVMGFATTTLNTNPASNSAANGVGASAGGYFEVQAGGTAQTWAYVGVRDNAAINRKIIGPGTVNTVVQDTDGRSVALSCPEAPENFFQDYGSGRLVNGRAHITLDPTLSMNIVVNDAHPLRAFVQLEGDCNGVYIANKSANGFDVIELGGGASNTAFSWTITANRADEVNPDGTVAHYSAERFPAAPLPVAKVEQHAIGNNDSIVLGAKDEPSPVPVLAPKAPRRR